MTKKKTHLRVLVSGGPFKSGPASACVIVDCDVRTLSGDSGILATRMYHTCTRRMKVLSFVTNNKCAAAFSVEVDPSIGCRKVFISPSRASYQPDAQMAIPLMRKPMKRKDCVVTAVSGCRRDGAWQYASQPAACRRPSRQFLCSAVLQDSAGRRLLLSLSALPSSHPFQPLFVRHVPHCPTSPVVGCCWD